MPLTIPKDELFAKGHRACAGCGAAIMVRLALKAAGKNTIVVCATGCLEVFSTPYPQTSWKVPFIHVAFENAAAVASGIDKALEKLGKREKTNILVFGGDGGTFDIGLQALSGAAERGDNICYICYDNAAYMNTGVQRSGATPKYAATTTSPVGKAIHGKQQFKKNMPLIMAAHNAYVATANIAYPQDFISKIKKALIKKGPSYIQVYSPCVPGWKYPSSNTIDIAKLAFSTNVYPLYEIEDGIVTINQSLSNPKPVKEYLETQGRFKHLNENEIKDIQDHINSEFEKLKKLEENKIKI